MWQLLAKPLLGVAVDGIKGFVETKKLNGEVKIAKIKAEKKKQLGRPNKTVDENLISLIAKIGEKITIGRAKTFNYGGSKNFNYLHTVVKDNLSKLAVLVSLETKNDSENLKSFGKQLCMHVAASNPLAIEANNIDKETLDKEIALISEELKNTGKPDDIVKKISLGKINKFKEDNALLTQPWVMEPKKKVRDIMNELNIINLKIKDFYRLKIGE